MTRIDPRRRLSLYGGVVYEFIRRTYRIIADDQPVMLIQEKFPVEEGHVIRDPA
jgi:chorismate-pyruvate lyase